MLEVEDVEGVVCTADDIGTTDRLQPLVQWGEGWGEKARDKDSLSS